MYKKVNEELNDESINTETKDSENKEKLEINTQKNKDNDISQDSVLTSRKKKNNRFKNKSRENNKIEPNIDPALAKKNTKRFAKSQFNDDIEEVVANGVRQPKQNKQTASHNIKKEPLKIKETPIVDENDKDKLIIAKNKKTDTFIYLPTKHRIANLMVLGLASSGKTSSILPLLLNQDLKNKNVGCTIFASDEDMVFKLYSLAKHYKRQVLLIKPSTNIHVLNEFLWMKDYDYEYIKNNIVDFEDAILKKKIVIIDMEYFKYRKNSKEAIIKLLSQYQVEMYNAKQSEMNNRGNKKTPSNYLYVDDAELYIKELIPILESGKSYNVSTTIFLKNRDLLIQNGVDYRPFIESNIRNYILMNGLGLNDIKYFSEKYEKPIHEIIGRKNGEIMYEILDESNSLAIGQGTIYQIDIKILDTIEQKAKKVKKQKIKFCKKIEKISNNIVFNKPINENNKDNINNKDIFTIINDAQEPYSDLPDNYKELDTSEKMHDNLLTEKFLDDMENSETEETFNFDESMENSEMNSIESSNNENKIETKNNALENLTEDEKAELDEINKKYPKVNLVEPNDNKKDISEIMESIMNSRHYLDPDEMDFND